MDEITVDEIKEMNWKEKAITEAKLMEISDGTRPDDNCTRVEAMAMASRAVDAAVKLFVKVLEEAVQNKF